MCTRGTQQLNRRMRRGFTFIELMIAASITVMTLAAGATMISAVANASMQTSDVRDVKKAGQMTADRFAALIRQARGIGEVTNGAIVLWNVDLNGDEKINLHETCRVTYNFSTSKFVRWQTVPSTAGNVGPVVPRATFESNTLMATFAAPYSPKEMVLSEDIGDFGMSGYPSKTETRIVNFRFAMRSSTSRHEFRASVTPRASADYLFNVNTYEASATAGLPSQRLKYSRWTGWADVNGTTPSYPGDGAAWREEGDD